MLYYSLLIVGGAHSRWGLEEYRCYINFGKHIRSKASEKEVEGGREGWVEG